MAENSMEKVVALAKRRGFIYPGSEIYGGLANTYDYGPLGTELLRNIKNLWWEIFVQKRSDIVGLDASLISHHRVWEASGHTAGFADAMIDCKNCKARMRADHLIENYLEKNADKLKDFAEHVELVNTKISKEIVEKYISEKKVEGLSPEQLSEIISLHEIKCPKCGNYDWTNVRKFNLLFPVQLGVKQRRGYLLIFEML
jgi:glycyl-tRNA synthetase